MSVHESWVRADAFFHHNLRNYYVDRWYISSLGLGRHDDNFIPKVEELLKKRGGVPKDAYLIGWFYEPQRSGITVRFAHKSFPETPINEVIETVDCHWHESSGQTFPEGK